MLSGMDKSHAPIFSRDNPPPFVDQFGNFVDAEFVCEWCGQHFNVAFHPAFLGNMSEVYKELDKLHQCEPPAADQDGRPA